MSNAEVFSYAREQVMDRLREIQQRINGVTLGDLPGPASLRISEMFDALATLEDLRLPMDRNGAL